MDKDIPAILPTDLSEAIGTATAPIVVDIRSADEVHAVDRLIPGALHRPSEDVQSWWRDLPSGAGVVVCDLSGGEKAWQVTKALRRSGTDAGYLRSEEHTSELQSLRHL